MEYQDEDDKDKESTWQGIKDGMFNIFVEMLKNRKVSRLSAGLFMSFMFLQIYGTVLTKSEFIKWDDDIAADSMFSIFELIRVIPAINSIQSASFFWFVYAVATLQILGTIAAFVYLIHCMIKKRSYASWPMNVLQANLTYFYWICYNPILETYVTINMCDEDGKHVIDKSLTCYSGVHIASMTISLILLLCAVAIALLISVLYQKTHPTSQDAMAHLENPLQMELIFYRTVLFLVCSIEDSYFGIFLIKYILMIGASVLFIYQYIKYLPYFDEFISTLYGYFCFLHAWVMAVSLLTFIISLTGHFIIFLVGVIPVYLVVQNIRTRRIEIILLTQPDRTTSELEAIIQCHAVYSLTTSKITPEQEIRLTGLVNLHQKECQNKRCPLYSAKELYDPCLDKFVDDGDVENLHKNQVFLKHFTKSYFDTAIGNFGNLPGIRISYAFFLFNAFRNVHAALTELVHAKKNKPNIMQSFEIYKFEYLFSSPLLK